MIDPYEYFTKKCSDRKIQIDVKEDKYLSLREEYKEGWSKIVTDCIDWLYDNDKKKITAGRLRTFAKKHKEWNKRDALKQMEKNQKQREAYHDKKESEKIKINQAAREKEKLRLAKADSKLAAYNEQQAQDLADYNRIKAWCLANREKAMAYMKKAEEIEMPRISMLSPQARKGIIKVRARMLIKEKELS